MIKVNGVSVRKSNRLTLECFRCPSGFKSSVFPWRLTVVKRKGECSMQWGAKPETYNYIAQVWVGNTAHTIGLFKELNDAVYCITTVGGGE